MEHTSKLHNTWPKKIFSENSRECYRIHKVIVFVFIQCMLCTAATIANTTPHSVDIIAEGLLEAEAQFTDLRLEYTASRRNWKAPNEPFRSVKAIYTQKSVITPQGRERLRYLDRKVSIIDPNTKQSTLVDDTLSSFNGEATIVLNRKIKSGKPMTGYILAGYNPNQFSRYDMDPHTKIWYFSGELLGNLIKNNENTFHIKSQSEILDGVSTVKLVGTIWRGKVTMTLWVSPERNFLPMKRQFVKTGGERLLMGTVLHDLFKLPNGTWYPKKIQSPAVPLGDPSPKYFLIYDISKISTDPMTEDFFRPEFPPNTHVIDDILKLSYTTY